jgi:Na+-transporting methylmalonyl-CoA/oxaloacetate decarboxylase gamma subunit
MRKATFRKISIVLLVLALVALLVQRIHRVVDRHVRTYPAHTNR